MRALRAGAVYFVAVFAAGFVLGVLRTLVLLPLVGPLWAVLVELPVILSIAWLVCARIVRRRPLGGAAAVGMGAVAFALMMLGDAGISMPRGTAGRADTFGRLLRTGFVDITGDHAGTATAISREMGIFDESTEAAVTGAELEAASDSELRRIVNRTETFARTSPEDKLRLVKALQVKHLKHWTVGSLLRSDILDRGIPWTRLLLREKAFANDLNLQTHNRVSVATTWLLALCLVMGFVVPWLWMVAIGAAGLLLALNTLKVPFPTLEYNTKGEFKFHYLYF